MKINQISLFILIIGFQFCQAQVFDDSQAHPSIKWQQINSSNIQLIFPSTFSKRAPALANQLEYYLKKNSIGANRKTRKISIIVQENHIQQNGFVQLAPRKSELYSTPSGISDNQQWLPNLALHESRHIIQFDNLTGNFKAPFLEQFGLALFALNLPSWYFEGDAVLQETLYSNGGRGRLASWEMPIRANIQSGNRFSFNKYVHGSYKDLVPSHYTIGYFLNSKIHEKDSLIQAKILKDMRGKLVRPFNFQRSLKKYYGSKASQIFKETMIDLEQKWSSVATQKDPNRLRIENKYPTNYLLPQKQKDKLYALQDGPQNTARIVEINPESGKILKKVMSIGQQIMPYFDVKDTLLTWDEYRKDARFAKQTYNVINVLNLKTNEKRTITSATRYYTPIINPDLKSIACVEVNLANISSLVVLDIKSGNKIDSIIMPAGIHIQQPRFHKNGKQLVAILIGPQGTTLAKIDLQIKSITQLIDWSNLQFERPDFHADAIIFKANQGNKDDLFSLENNVITQLTDSRFGAFNPSINDSTVWYNDYDIDGYQINHTRIGQNIKNNITFIPAKPVYKNQELDSLSRLTPLTTEENYEIKPYNSLKNAINFHSLTLSGSDFESFDNLKPGIFWLSNDVLNTTELKVGYEYDNDIKKSIYSAELSYQKYYPKFNIAYQNRGQIGAIANKPGSTFDWREHFLSLDIQLPFSIYRGNTVYSYGFNFGTSYQKRYDLSIQNLKDFNMEIKFPLNYQVYFNKNALRSVMDITPRWGQNFSITYRHIPFDNTQKGNQLSFRSNFYFPGILPNHGLQVRYAMQNKSGRYNYNNDIPLVTGFAYVATQNLKNTLLLDYRLPLFYPDLSINQLAYIKRVRGEISAGYQNIHNTSMAPKTIGAGINIDFHLFKYTLPIFSFNSKATYLNDANASQSWYFTYGFTYTY